MNMNQISNMILRVLLRKAVNTGVNAGIGAATSLNDKRKEKRDVPEQANGQEALSSPLDFAVESIEAETSAAPAPITAKQAGKPADTKEKPNRDEIRRIRQARRARRAAREAKQNS
ncbi:MAG: hypothetical protein AB3N11_04180 [Arenibacterium sp.]